MNKIIGCILAAFILLAGYTVAMAMDNPIKIQEKEGIGKYLTDNNGMTLYWFKKDTPGKSACEGPCVDKWPIYYQESAKVPAGMKAGELATITRSDGKKQTTFRGYPLYYWMNDKKAGETLGQGVNNVWYIVNPGNFPPN